MDKQHVTTSDARSFFDLLLPNRIKWKGVQGSTRCPFHRDRKPSFSVNWASGQWYCHAGCGGGSLKQLAERLGSDPPAPPSSVHVNPAPVATKKTRQHDIEYIYQDIHGAPVFLVGRDQTPEEGKKFCIYHFSEGAWVIGKGTMPSIPYMLPNVRTAIAQGMPVIIVEGEKDVDTLTNAYETFHFAATTNMCGALKWGQDDEFNRWFQDASVLIIPDNDEVGRQHAAMVERSVSRWAKHVSIVSLQGLIPKGDVTDWLESGHKAEELLNIVQDEVSRLTLKPSFKVEQDVIRKYFDGHYFIPKLLAEDIQQKLPCFSDGVRLFCFQNGVYRPNGALHVGKFAQEMLGNEYRINKAKEVIHYIETISYVDASEINLDDGCISVENGILDLQTGLLHAYDAMRISTIQLPVRYDPEADCPRIRSFFSQVLPGDAIATIEEFIGYCLTMNAKFEKALMLTGTGANGKSTFIKLLSKFLGKHNTTSIPLQELADSRWKRADLQGVLLNSFADISGRHLESSSLLKAIVSGDHIDAERKGKDPFYFSPFAKLLFSANELPGSKDLSFAFMRRWIVVPFPNRFEHGKTADPDLLDKLCTPEEMSGLLNLALQGFARLYTNKQFTENETTRRAKENFLFEVDSVVQFVTECCVLQEGASCTKIILYQAYTSWCQQFGMKPLGRTSFYKRLEEQYLGVTRKRHCGQREHWSGIQLLEFI